MTLNLPCHLTKEEVMIDHYTHLATKTLYAYIIAATENQPELREAMVDELDNTINLSYNDGWDDKVNTL